MSTFVENEQNTSAMKGKNDTIGTIMAIASLICGLVALCTAGIFFVPEIGGVVFAFLGKKDGKMHVLAKIGLACSIISFVILLVFVIITLMAFAGNDNMIGVLEWMKELAVE